MQTIDDGYHIFLTGGAGVGKSHTIGEVGRHYSEHNKKVLKLASTGMAATHIGGQTLHSFFQIGIANSLQMLQESRRFEISKELKTLIGALDVIIIDEISMVSSGVMELIKFRLLQGGFKGSLMVVGDFLQLPPIFKAKDSEQFMKKYPFLEKEKVFGYAFVSDAWSFFNFRTFELTEIKRTTDEIFMHILNDVRFGFFYPQHEAYFSGLIRPYEDAMGTHTFLYPKNVQVVTHNLAELQKAPGLPLYLDAVVDEQRDEVSEEEVDKFIEESRLSKRLELKIGVPVLFLRNAWNYYNGERGVVTDVDEKSGMVYIKKSDARTVKLERESFAKKEWIEEEATDGSLIIKEVNRLVVKQFPIALAYAITIHKSQGMSLERVVVDADEIFAPSQFYVAISRATTPEGLILKATMRKLKSLIRVDKEAIKFVMKTRQQQRG